jgi:hypothetical protein
MINNSVEICLNYAEKSYEKEEKYFTIVTIVADALCVLYMCQQLFSLSLLFKHVYHECYAN